MFSELLCKHFVSLFCEPDHYIRYEEEEIKESCACTAGFETISLSVAQAAAEWLLMLIISDRYCKRSNRWVRRHFFFYEEQHQEVIVKVSEEVEVCTNTSQYQ